MRIARGKQVEIARCDGAIMRTATRLDRLMAEGRLHGLDLDEADDIAPLAIQVVELRRERRRLEKELRAIASEWAA